MEKVRTISAKQRKNEHDEKVQKLRQEVLHDIYSYRSDFRGKCDNWSAKDLLHQAHPTYRVQYARRFHELGCISENQLRIITIKNLKKGEIVL
jgi:hypothetical protein